MNAEIPAATPNDGTARPADQQGLMTERGCFGRTRATRIA
jgi:hypothetical protein